MPIQYNVHIIFNDLFDSMNQCRDSLTLIGIDEQERCADAYHGGLCM